jgi:tetratricopeptide (TPR) repeat protein
VSAIRKDVPKFATSFVAALLVGALTYLSLITFRERNPDQETLSRAGGTALTLAMEEAEAYLNRQDYSAAIAVLEDPIERAKPGPQLTDANFLLLEARYRNFNGTPGSPRYLGLVNDLDTLAEDVPTHPKAHRAKYWKAKLYQREDYLIYSAQDEYEEIFKYYPTAPNSDDIFIDAAHLALELDDPLAAGRYSRHLIQQFPGSTNTAQANMILGDAYALAGSEADARTRYVEIAERQPNSTMGAEAFLNLAMLAYKNQEFDLTIHHLQTRLETSTTTDGNDEVYLLLAQALRNENRLEEARDTLNDFLNFFPESAVTPRVYIELTQIQDDLGQRDLAVQLARQAAIQYPDHPQVLHNKGQLLGLAGNPLGAAQALVQADEAGLNDPTALLSAARYYNAATMLDNATDIYERLTEKYPGTTQALTGGIEAARTIYALGRITNAIDRLENLALATRGTDQYLSTLLAMNEIYQDLELQARVTETAEEIVKLSQEPEILAAAADALLQANSIQTARPVIDNLDLSRVRNETAYQLLMQYGTKLLELNPALGLEKMEEAYLGYPESRTLQNDQILLETYLAVDRSAAARRMVMELKANADANPENASHLVKGAIAWGDFLYDRRDFRAATNAFQMAIDAAKQVTSRDTQRINESLWAKFQRANALLELAEFDESLRLYDELAQTNVPWASDASVKARFARLEKRRRGIL